MFLPHSIWYWQLNLCKCLLLMHGLIQLHAFPLRFLRQNIIIAKYVVVMSAIDSISPFVQLFIFWILPICIWNRGHFCWDHITAAIVKSFLRLRFVLLEHEKLLIILSAWANFRIYICIGHWFIYTCCIRVNLDLRTYLQRIGI